MYDILLSLWGTATRYPPSALHEIKCGRGLGLPIVLVIFLLQSRHSRHSMLANAGQGAKPVHGLLEPLVELDRLLAITTFRTSTRKLTHA